MDLFPRRQVKVLTPTMTFGANPRPAPATTLRLLRVVAHRILVLGGLLFGSAAVNLLRQLEHAGLERLDLAPQFLCLRHEVCILGP